MMNVKCTWVDFFDGFRIMAVDMTEYVGEFPQIQHNGTHDAYMNLIDGQEIVGQSGYVPLLE